jgi:hypothetical protein
MKKTTEKRYETLELQKKGKLIITEDVKKKIDQMHNRIGSVEWCGFIFYEKVEGSISNPETYVAKTTDIYMMDIGSHSYTESDNHTEDVINMVDRVPAYMENRYGLIHTHHNMSAFFSGTDDQELHDNVHLYSYYLSLIVNFDGKWCAKIANLIDVNSSSYTITEEDEEDVLIEIPAKKVMITFDLDIEFEQTEAYDDVVELRIDEIQERKKKEAEEKKAKMQSFNNNPYQLKMFDDINKNAHIGWYAGYKEWYDQYDNLTKSPKIGFTEDDEIEWFISCLIYLDEHANEPLHDALEDLKNHESDPYFSVYVDEINDNALQYAVDHFGVAKAYSGVCSTLQKLEPYSGKGVEKLRDALEDAKEQLNKNNEYSL